MSQIELTKPPVVELVIGAQFEGVVFTNEYIFNHYQLIKDNFPNIKDNPPLPVIIESTTTQSQPKLLQGFHSRRFFINKSGNRLIQIQPDKLLINWRKSTEDDTYPKFSAILEEFEALYASISKDHKDICDKLNQLEVTFVDHVFIDDFGLQIFDLKEIFNPISFSDPAKSLQFNISIPHEDLLGNLKFDVRTATSNKDNRKLLACETTCRGMKDNDETITDWYNRAHETLLDFFISLFTDKAKAIWGIKS